VRGFVYIEPAGLGKHKRDFNIPSSKCEGFVYIVAQPGLDQYGQPATRICPPQLLSVAWLWHHPPQPHRSPAQVQVAASCYTMHPSLSRILSICMCFSPSFCHVPDPPQLKFSLFAVVANLLLISTPLHSDTTCDFVCGTDTALGSCQPIAHHALRRRFFSCKPLALVILLFFAERKVLCWVVWEFKREAAFRRRTHSCNTARQGRGDSSSIVAAEAAKQSTEAAAAVQNLLQWHKQGQLSRRTRPWGPWWCATNIGETNSKS
jgi:hypothetical protein